MPCQMPQDMAATFSRTGWRVMLPARSIFSVAMRSATQAPVMAAVRVPPSA